MAAVSYLVHYDTLLQSATDIVTKCDSYFITKCDKDLLQNALAFFYYFFITMNCEDFFFFFDILAQF